MAASTAVDELTVKRLEGTIGELDDATLIFVMLGLLSEAEDAPSWGRTANARCLARIAFTEIAQRWMPHDTFAAAYAKIAADDQGDDDDRPQ